MIPNLLEATQEYWQKLDKLESDYQAGKVTIEEVDAQVEYLMKELGQKRRASINYFLRTLRYSIVEQKEVVMGIAILGVLSYSWLLL